MLEKLLPLLFLFAFAVNASDGEDGPSNSTTPVPAPAPPPNNGINNEGGAAGGAGNEYSLSRGGLIAIIVVVVVVAVFGSKAFDRAWSVNNSDQYSRLLCALLHCQKASVGSPKDNQARLAESCEQGRCAPEHGRSP